MPPRSSRWAAAAALAESAWMGTPQASDVLEPVRLVAPGWRPAQMRLPSLRALLTRELSVAEASAVLMLAFFSSALMGAVRQALFNAQFGAGPAASAYYAAARLPEVLFSLVAGGALSSAMIPVLLGVTRDGGEVAGARLVRLVLTALLTHNLGVIGGVLLAGATPGLGISGPAIGVVAGGALQLIILVPGLLARGYRLGLAWTPADPDLRAVGRLLAPNGVSVGVNYAGTILDTAFASLAPQAAGLAALINAWMLAGLPVALLGQAVGQSAFPRLAAHAEDREWPAYRRTLTRALLAAALLALPALGALLLLGRQAIAVIFERGRFDAAAGDLTFTLLAIYAVTLPFYVATEVLTRGLTALRDTRTPLATNSAQIAGRAALLALLVPRIGVAAIPLAFALTSALESLVLLAALMLRLRRVSQGGIAP